MSARRYVPARGVAKAVLSSVTGRAALHALGGEAARAATARGKRIAPSYEADVEDGVSGVRIVANTTGRNIPNAAAWIEFGTPELPPAAPLRTGCSEAGLELRP